MATATLPTVKTLVAAATSKAHLLENCEFEVVWYAGDMDALWAASHPSYLGMRAVSLRCTDLDGDVYEIVFFDHEDDAGTYTFVIVQFNN